MGRHLHPRDRPWLHSAQGGVSPSTCTLCQTPAWPAVLQPGLGEFPGTSLRSGSLLVTAPPWGSCCFAGHCVLSWWWPSCLHMELFHPSPCPVFSLGPSSLPAPNHLDKLVCSKMPRTSTAPGDSGKSGFGLSTRPGSPPQTDPTRPTGHWQRLRWSLKAINHLPFL